MDLKRYQEKTLGALSGKIPHFYLVGGTALSLFYFQHRESIDLDFFTKTFNRLEIRNILNDLKTELKKPIQLISEQTSPLFVKMMRYHILFTKRTSLKVDFVEDPTPLLKPLKIVDHIPLASLEDIYLRKIFTVTGSTQTTDLTGRPKRIGGREEAKDFYDLYCLSQIFMKLSDFTVTYCDLNTIEALIRWFKTYDRLHIKTGLLELKTTQKANYSELERHFKKEIIQLAKKI